MRIFEESSTITAKGQTTIPKAVRQVLGVGVGVGDEIAFRVKGQQVTVVPAATLHEDPLVGKFLDFISKDIERHPVRMKPLSKKFAARMASLMKGNRVDVNASIDGDVDL